MSEDEIKKYAKELVNSTYQPLGYLKCMVSSDEMWEWAKKRTLYTIELMKQNIPMYTGNLNPKWKEWDNTEMQRMFFN